MLTTLTPNGTALKEDSTFSMSCGVAITINAQPDVVWDLLTDASHITDWNSTIIEFSGQIAQGQTIKLKSSASPDREFKLNVSTFDKPHTMVWQDGMAPMFKGVRTYTLTDNGNGSTVFTMREVFSGLMLPMIKGSLPDFRPSFEQFAEDLKVAAES